MSKDSRNKTVLITGASGGIGLEFVKQIAAQKYDLVLVSRSEKKLNQIKEEMEHLHGIKGYVIPADLSKIDGPEKVFAACQQQGIQVDILINNAGKGLAKATIQQNPAESNEMLILNILSLTNMCILFGKAMADRGHGYIMNVGSVAGQNAIPYFAAYSASKNYVLAYTIALKHELKKKGVNVTCLQPGFVRTGFDSNSSVTSDKYMKMSEKSGMAADKVARIGIKAMFRKKTVCTAGFSNKLSIFFGGMIPRTLTSGIMEGYLAKLLD